MDRDRNLMMTQLLVSHLCHELVSPISAVNNGVELIEESCGAQYSSDAFDLISESGRMAAARLRFYRLAYGSAGLAKDFMADEARTIALDLVALDRRVTLDWPVEPDLDLPIGGPQLLLNLILLGVNCLPRGGAVQIDSSPAAVGPRLRCRAFGTGARLTESMRAALESKPFDLDHRSIHVAWTNRLARGLGGALTVEQADDQLSLATVLMRD